MMTLRRIVYGLIVLWLLASCNSQTRSHQFRHFDQEAWYQDDTVRFEIPLTDSLTNHELTLQLRHTSQYPYQNLAIGIEILSPDSQVTRTMNINEELTDQEGYWKGSGLGGLYQLNIGQTTLPKAKAGTWLVHIFHTMSDSILIGVNDIGVRVRKYELQNTNHK